MAAVSVHQVVLVQPQLRVLDSGGETALALEETEDSRRYWQSELDRLRELRDNTTKMQAGLDYATERCAIR